MAETKTERVLNTRLILRNDTQANWELTNPILKKGEMGIEINTNKFKFGDGKTPWKELPYGTHIPANMIYFNNDIPLAGNYTNVGNVKIERETLTAKDKSVEDLFNDIFTKELDPSKSNPYVSEFTLTCGTSFEAGTTITPSWTTGFNAGSYTYKTTELKNPIVPLPKSYGTGVKVTSWSILQGSEEISTSANGSGASFIIGDSNITFKAVATHTNGNYALTNLNKLPATDVQILGGTENKKEKSAIIYTYRKEFAGGTTNMGTINSALIRGLSKSRAWSTNAFEFQAAVGDTKLIFAFPKSKSTKTPKFEYFTMSWESFAGFNHVADVKVGDSRGGANGQVDYTVYEYIPAGAFAAPTKFRVMM